MCMNATQDWAINICFLFTLWQKKKQKSSDLSIGSRRRMHKSSKEYNRITSDVLHYPHCYKVKNVKQQL